MASPAVKKAITEAAAHYVKPEGKVFQYGTAGVFPYEGVSFAQDQSTPPPHKPPAIVRLLTSKLADRKPWRSDLLNTVVFAVGLLAGLRSKKLSGQWIGVMVTASHNPAEDNGVKLIDPMGEMLEAEWEQYATRLANAPLDQIADVYDELVKEIDVKMTNPARVVFARDTRASGSRLVGVLNAALTATEVEFIDFKYMTTPQLHYVVRCKNTLGTQYEYGVPTEQGYYEKLAASFKKVMKGVKVQGSLTVDCANGVGGPKLRDLIKYLDSALDIKVVNDDVINPDSLNFDCGADYVKTKQRAPPSSKAAPLDRCASLDGDADRLVYYFVDESNVFRLLDGDRIATLAASFIGDLARNAGIAQKLKIGVVQTAYANGASTDYIEKVLKLPIICTNTGVKHLHHAALRFDVGVYFEANGHGTVTFSENALKVIKNTEPQSPAQQHSLECLQALTDLINQAVGDALSDMLLVEAILAHKGWSPKEWLGTYTDLPSRLVRVEVHDRSIFKAYDAERKLESPVGLQGKIESLQSRYNKGRSFARASGTEDAVRVYAEAASRSEADDLATRVANAVREAGTEAQ
ncbi:Phosphoacetylglucosamine mutase [Penicillium daleae]|uniref:Phosphoacetylglucosamine mutase n=1 Tax=Penicillium daleae TaxID=63821 RepID=A0AAD6G0P2_9EURO|nr:Phosphoacetylglucosamine mutase [Penicillium daleae]KAJ5443994.1 Phosphoacetylglucosamine mutase [Penicillium daleae]